jgi:hypothetical protein
MKRSHRMLGLAAVFSAALLLTAFVSIDLSRDKAFQASSANPYLNQIPALMRSAYEDEQQWFEKMRTALLEGNQDQLEKTREEWKVAQDLWCARISGHATKVPPAEAIPIHAVEVGPYVLSQGRIVNEPTTVSGAKGDRPCRHGLYMVATLTLTNVPAGSRDGRNLDTLFVSAVDHNGIAIPGTEVPLWGGVVDRSTLASGQPMDVMIRWSMRQAANMENFAGVVQITHEEYERASQNKGSLALLVGR